MRKKITIVLDDDLNKKIRLMQAKKMLKTNANVSYSDMVNEILRQDLK